MGKKILFEGDLRSSDAELIKRVKFILFALLFAGLVIFLGTRDNSAHSGSGSTDASALEKMSAVFVGRPSVTEIRALMDPVLSNFSQIPSEDIYNRLGSVLVVMRKDSGVPEMHVLRCMRGLGTTFRDKYAEAAAICATTLELKR